MFINVINLVIYGQIVPNKIMFAASLDTSDADIFMEMPKSACT